MDSHYCITFKYEDIIYQTAYSSGLTEHQDESPWEYDGNEIECDIMEAVVEVIETTKYMRIPLDE